MSILRCILLYRLFINVVIRYIWVYQNRIYNLRRRKCQKARKLWIASSRKPFFGHISENKHLKVYVDWTKTQNWVEWTAPSVSLSQTKVNDINLNDCPQMQNDTENEIGRSLFPFIYNCNRLRKTTQTQLYSI